MTSAGDQRQGKATGSNASRFKFPHCPHCHEQVIPDTRWCPACGGGLDALRNAPEGDVHPLSGSRWQAVSLGLDPLGRRLGTAIAGLFVAWLPVAWTFYLQTPRPTDALVFVLSGAGLFGAYDVWAFTHGKTTSITRYGRHEATPANTIPRVLGLLLDLMVMAACVWVFWLKS